MQNLIAAIYAGGRGLRLGNVDKALLEQDGTPFHTIVSSKLLQLTNDIIILSNDRPAWIDDIPGSRHVKDEISGTEMIGPAGGLRAALAYASNKFGPDGYVLTHPIDAPNVSDHSLAVLVEQAVLSGKTTLASHGRAIEPAFAVWRSSDHNAVAEAIEQGQHALRSLARHVGAEIYKFEDVGDQFLNINRPEDLLQGRVTAGVRDTFRSAAQRGF